MIIEFWGMPGVGKTFLAGVLRDKTWRSRFMSKQLLTSRARKRTFGRVLRSAFLSLIFAIAFCVGVGFLRQSTYMRVQQFLRVLLRLSALRSDGGFHVMDEGPVTWLAVTKFSRPAIERYCWKLLDRFYVSLGVILCEVTANEVLRLQRVESRSSKSMNERTQINNLHFIKLYGEERRENLMMVRQRLPNVRHMRAVNSCINPLRFMELATEKCP